MVDGSHWVKHLPKFGGTADLFQLLEARKYQFDRIRRSYEQLSKIDIEIDRVVRESWSNEQIEGAMRAFLQESEKK